MEKKEDVFKLVFNTDGVFIGVEPPKGKELKFGPEPIGRLSFDQLRGKNIPLEDGDYCFEDLLVAGNIEMKLLIVNSPGNSICGGSCGGWAFSWC